MSLKSEIALTAVLDADYNLISFNPSQNLDCSLFELELLVLASVDEIKKKISTIKESVLETNKSGKSSSKHYLGQILSSAFHRCFAISVPGSYKIVIVTSDNIDIFDDEAIYIHLVHLQSVFLRALCNPFNQNWDKIDLSRLL